MGLECVRLCIKNKIHNNEGYIIEHEIIYVILHEYKTLPPQVNGINCWDRKENETESILRNF